VGVYAEQILPRLTDLACGAPGMERYRRRAVEGLRGVVVEIGFGSGLNLPLYPPEVTEVLVVEPSEVARRRSQQRRRAAGPAVYDIGLDGQSIQLGDDSCDGALSTFTLCTIPDPAAALAELRRVLRPGGRFHFLEHGIAPDDGVRRWQHRLEPLQRRVAGGCHLCRDAPALVRAAGFDLEQLEQRYVRGPRPWSYFSIGHAVAPAGDEPDR
jgi:SAM-dependent methyltransferase